jgi:NADPH-dependent 2,4-dienoyl-CoA reductase/sulfur reductase-like enzyme
VGAAAIHPVDIEAVRAEGDPAQWVREVAVPANPAEFSCDILVAGAGAGGVAAALAAAGRGHSVCLTEESSWIRGQITSGGVSALDENRCQEAPLPEFWPGSYC